MKSPVTTFIYFRVCMRIMIDVPKVNTSETAKLSTSCLHQISGDYGPKVIVQLYIYTYYVYNIWFYIVVFNIREV